MKTLTPIALTASLLLAGAAAAAAAANPGISAAKPGDMAGGLATANLSLNNAQQKTAWKDLYMPTLNQSAPAGFSATIGSTVPKSVTTAPVTAKAARDVPALRPYDFAAMQHKLVIVNPSNDKIVDVISG